MNVDDARRVAQQVESMELNGDQNKRRAELVNAIVDVCGDVNGLIKTQSTRGGYTSYAIEAINCVETPALGIMLLLSSSDERRVEEGEAALRTTDTETRKVIEKQVQTLKNKQKYFKSVAPLIDESGVMERKIENWAESMDTILLYGEIESVRLHQSDATTQNTLQHAESLITRRSSQIGDGIENGIDTDVVLASETKPIGDRAVTHRSVFTILVTSDRDEQGMTADKSAQSYIPIGARDKFAKIFRVYAKMLIVTSV